jgi:hypothetical protein
MDTASGAVCFSTGERFEWQSCQSPPVVALDGIDSATELSMNISKEVGQSGEGVRFKLKWKSQ